MKIYIKNALDLDQHIKSRSNDKDNLDYRLASEDIKMINDAKSKLSTKQLDAYLRLIRPDLFKSRNDISQSEFDEVIRLFMESSPRRPGERSICLGSRTSNKFNEYCNRVESSLSKLGFTNFSLSRDSNPYSNLWYLDFDYTG